MKLVKSLFGPKTRGRSISFALVIVAYIVISWFMSYIQKRDLSLFGWYRILLGIIVLVIYLLG